MFSIINTDGANVLVLYSPGSQAATLAPRSARPARAAPAIERVWPLSAPAARARLELIADGASRDPGCSRTPASSDACASSHTREFS